MLRVGGSVVVPLGQNVDHALRPPTTVRVTAIVPDADRTGYADISDGNSETFDTQKHFSGRCLRGNRCSSVSPSYIAS